MWSAFVKNMRTGFTIGLALATAFAAVAATLAGLTQGNPFEPYGLSFGRGIATYFATGAVVGAAGGLLAPLARWTTGLVFIGAVCGALTSLVILWAEHSAVSGDNRTAFILGGSALIGAVAAPIWRAAWRRGMERVRLRREGRPQ